MIYDAANARLCVISYRTLLINWSRLLLTLRLLVVQRYQFLLLIEARSVLTPLIRVLF